MVALTLQPKMERDFQPGNSANLPRMDCLTVAAYLITMPIPEKNAANTKSLKECYSDDAIGYVQLCRRRVGLCILKARVCPQPDVHADVTLTFHETQEKILHIQCHNCEAPDGCMHRAAFLLWLHRRSEEPCFPYRECYWRMPKKAEF